MPQLRVGYHGNPALILPHMVVTLTKQEEDEYFKCMIDPAYFIRTYVQIVQATGLNPFNMYPYQEDMVKAFIDHRFSICKIPRQYGKSTLMCAYILHQVLFNENFVVAVICDKKELAKELLSRIKLGYEHLPNFLKQAIIGWNKGDIELANGSKIKTFAASARGVAGNSINLLYLDEFAHVPENQAQAFYAGAYPVITSFPDSKVIITSTPAGLNMFHDFWERAQRKVNDYFPIEVHWSAIPGRDEKWKEETIARTSPEQFAVEFECEFLGSSNTLISGSKLSILMSAVQRTIIQENGLDLYEVPLKEHIYALVVDVAEGQNKDYSAFSIIDVTKIPYRQIGKYRSNKISPMLFPSVIYNVARRFNDAHILVEINSIGLQVATILWEEFGYENLFKIDKKSNQGIGQHITPGFRTGINLGVKTSTTIKRIGCANLKTLVESDKLILLDTDTVIELKTFTAHKESFAATDGKHDDLAMTLVLFGWLSSQSYFREIVDNNVRNIVHEENIRTRDDLIAIHVQKSGQPLSDPYNLNWKGEWEKLEQDNIEAWSEVDDHGDRWFPVHGNW